jgi:sugar/nucleoside kinase (ribokinase family)
MVQSFPEKGMLATITEESLAVGGCVCNTAIDIKKVDPDMDVCVFGKIGKDSKGEYALNQMKEVGLDVSGVKYSQTAPTSYSDVITVIGTGERTFFHNRGANKEFCPADIDVDSLDCKILHAGYVMLLDAFDKLNENGSTPMSEFLQAVQNKGIKTSIDLVSESSGDFFKIASSALKYCNYAIINEIEASSIANIPVRNEDGLLIEENIKPIMQKLIDLGVKDKVIVHCPECGYALSSNGDFTFVKSKKIPNGFIKGSVGAGDAFCAGSLYALYHDYTDEQLLEFANLVAISCLSEKDSVSGVKHKDQLKTMLN